MSTLNGKPIYPAPAESRKTNHDTYALQAIFAVTPIETLKTRVTDDMRRGVRTREQHCVSALGGVSGLRIAGYVTLNPKP